MSTIRWYWHQFLVTSALTLPIILENFKLICEIYFLYINHLVLYRFENEKSACYLLNQNFL